VLAFLLCLPFIFLFTRLPPPELAPECLSRVTVGWAHFVHVCDSYSMTQVMGDLPGYFTQPNAWWPRPLYIIGGEALAVVFRPAALLVRHLLIDGRISGDGNFAVDLFLARFPEYFALMIVNFAVLGATIWMAMRLIGPSVARHSGSRPQAENPSSIAPGSVVMDSGLVAPQVGCCRLGHLMRPVSGEPEIRWRPGTTPALAAALGTAVATCDLVHGLFWTQHSNFLNIVVPLGCITYFVAGCRARQMTQTSIAVLGLGAGVAALAYAYIVIWLPLFVFGSLYRDLRMAAAPAEMLRGLVRTLVPLGTAGCGPVLAWWAINKYVMHGMISYEIDVFRQFVWIADAWHDGRLGAALAEHWNGYLRSVWIWLGWPAPVSLAGIALLLWLGRRDWGLAQALADPILLAVAVTIVTMLIFNFLQGYYQPRLVNGITLALFVALARTAQKANRGALGAAVLLAIAATQVADAFLQPAISLT
jgi:hypothetical protein